MIEDPNKILKDGFGIPVKEKQQSSEEVQEETQESLKPKAVKKQKEESLDEKIFSALEALEEEIEIDEMSVYLPALKESITVIPIKSEEEFLLENPNLTMYDFIKKLNKLIFTHIKPVNDDTNFPKTVKEFEEKISSVDRTLILFALLKNSFEKLTEFNMQCEKCNKEFIADATVENMNMFFEMDEDEILTFDFNEYKVTQKYINGSLEIDLGYNTEKTRMFLLGKTSEEEASENIYEKNNLFDILDNFIMYIKEIRVYKTDKRTKDGRKMVQQFKSLEEIYEFIHNLPFKLKEIVINNIDLTPLEKYLPVYKLNVICPYCGHVKALDLSPELEFFRKALYYS